MDGVATHTPTFLEILQALGVFGVVGLMFTLGIKFMPILPTEARVPERPGNKSLR